MGLKAVGVFLLAMVLTSVFGYSQVSSLEEFRKVVILENGRKKPLDTFSQNMLKQFSGESRYEGQPAINWMARVLFTPQDSYNDKIFLVTNPDVLDSMEIEREGKARDRYSYSQLKPGIEKLHSLALAASRIKDSERSFTENEILGLYNKIYIYEELLVSFEFFRDREDFSIHSDETLKVLEFPLNKKSFNYFDLVRKYGKVRQILASISAKPEVEWTEAEKEIEELSKRMEKWQGLYKDHPLSIIPSIEKKGDVEEEKWLSAWALIEKTAVNPGGGIPRALILMNDIFDAYLRSDQQTFDKAIKELDNLVTEKAGTHLRPDVIGLEVFYNKLDPFYKAEFFYGFSVIFLLISFIALKKWFYRLSFLLLGVGFVLHLIGVILRIEIMARPPVTNLYETFMFTGLITALLGMILEWMKKRNIGILTGSLSGIAMLLIAGKYAMDGDTMGMLVAVLDSNFWLASHVISIILGYSGILLSGVIGHVYLIQRVFNPKNEELLKNTFQGVYAIQAFGLVFTFLGTMLGGVWADQSWGRFWGWDPKENGALLILLWSAILFHARLAGWIKETGFCLGSIMGIIAVALAWFGVNLLGVGLHSYGFTAGVANALFIFISIEGLLILLFLIKFRFKLK